MLTGFFDHSIPFNVKINLYKTIIEIGKNFNIIELVIVDWLLFSMILLGDTLNKY